MTDHITKDQIFINRLTEIILANLGKENFGVKELSQEVKMSQYSLSLRLRSSAKKTINQFISEVRLRKALEMLKYEEKTVSEVAYKIGFSSPAYFTKCFHDFFGYPPGVVKKDFIANNEEIISPEVKENKIKLTRKIFIVTASFILFIIVFVYLGYSLFFKNASTYTGEAVIKPEYSIAVIPFKSIGNNQEDQFFIDGVMEEILTNLSRIHNLRVISRTSVEQFRESTRSASDIARKLNVEYIVEGSGQKYGNLFRLRVQLIDASKDKHIWAESYQQEISEVKDIFKIQSQVAQAIASELKTTITPEEKQLIEKTPTSSLTAYDFYRRGLEALQKYGLGGLNKESVKRAEILFRNALEYDSTYALAYTGLAEVCWKKYYLENYLSNYMDSVLIFANKALSYDDQLAEAYFDRAGYYDYKGNPKLVIEEYDKALRFNPNDWICYWGKGVYYEDYDMVKSITNFQKAASLNHGPQLTEALRRAGDIHYQIGFPEKGNHFLLEALKLDGDSVKHSISLIIYAAEASGDYNIVSETYKKRFLTDSANANVLLRIGYYYALVGNYQESLKYFNKYLSIIKTGGYCNPWTKLMEEYLIGYAYAENGFKEKSDLYFERSIETYSNLIKFDRKGESRYYFYRLAGIFNYRGEKRKAYEYLNKLCQSPIFSIGEITLIKHDPLFKSIRNEPAFQSIVKNMEVRYQAEHERVRKWMEEQGKL